MKYTNQDYIYPFIHENEDGKLRLIEEKDLSAIEDANKLIIKIFNIKRVSND